MDQYIGKMLDNRYEILERIGTGGMAVVYKAKCHRLNRLVAIKILKSDLAQDEDFRRRFNAESQAVAQLSHPNIVSVYDVSKGGDIEYIVMELIDGITLKQYMEKRGQLNWRESLHFITQIMRGLSHAHSRGIVHRDIKPQNIMVLRDGSVKVADFGIACLENSAQTLTQEALGSVHYISPEQARGDRTDARSDIYSAGVVLYEMLTNRLPFEGDSAVSVAIQHLSSIPLAPREINPDIPASLELICMKAMAPDLDRRYPSADAMIADLESFRKNPGVNLDFEMNDIRPEEPDEPTRLIRTPAASSPHHTAVRDPREYERERSPSYKPEERSPARRGKKKSTALIVGAVCLALVAVFFLYRMIFGSLGSENVQHTVPNVVGYTVDEANALSDVKGVFKIEVSEYQPSDKYAKDVIMDQDPKPDEVKKGANLSDNLVITVTVSSGENTGEMIDVTGKEAREAKVDLEKMEKQYNLSLTIDDSEELQENSDEVTAGYVIRTDPAAGESLKDGDTIQLIVSKGPETKPVTVILFEGSQIDLVKQQLKTLGLTLGDVKEEESDQPAGEVLKQSIKADTRVDEGTKIDFTVSKGSGTSQSESSEQLFTVALPNDGRTTVHLQIVQDGKVVADEPSVDCSQGSYAKMLTGTGTSTVQVYIDGSLYETKTVTFDG